MTPLQEAERRAMLDRGAALEVVSALRRYRAAAQRLLARRYGDGAVDGTALSEFASKIEEIEGTG